MSITSKTKLDEVFRVGCIDGHIEQQSSITVYRLPTKETKRPFVLTANKRKVSVSSFRLLEINGNYHFPSVPFFVRVCRGVCLRVRVCVDVNIYDYIYIHIYTLCCHRLLIMQTEVCCLSVC